MIHSQRRQSSPAEVTLIGLLSTLGASRNSEDVRLWKAFPLYLRDRTPRPPCDTGMLGTQRLHPSAIEHFRISSLPFRSGNSENCRPTSERLFALPVPPPEIPRVLSPCSWRFLGDSGRSMENGVDTVQADARWELHLDLVFVTNGLPSPGKEVEEVILKGGFRKNLSSTFHQQPPGFAAYSP